MKYAFCGKHRVSANELKLGMKVEREHTARFRNPARARLHEKRTACDHIVGEHPKYYSQWLLPMERKMKRSMKSAR